MNEVKTMEKKGKPTELRYEIINEIGVVSTKASWRLEVNRISWDGREPKYDIRSWSAGRTKMGKGITLTEEELVKLYEVLKAEVEFLQSDDM